MPLARREFLLQSAAASLVHAAAIDVTRERWNARWILPPGAPVAEYGVHHFRRGFELPAKPARFLVHVSGDARYELYCNGIKVCWGPARGDLNHWRYETADLAAHLRPGRNVLAAVVWNDGPHAALSQWSHRTAFVLQADESAHEKLVNSGPEWRTATDPAYRPIPVPNYQPTGYYAIGPCEEFDAARHPWGWEGLEFDDSSWKQAEAYRNASPRDQRDAPTRWMLVPRPIPPMEETPQRLLSVREAQGIEPPPGFPFSRQSLTVPANSKAVLLLDQGALTTAFPVLETTGGRGARISLDYTEALYEEMKPRRRKGNRGATAGKTFVGYGDVYRPDGGRRTWRPLYWRTYRYLRLTVETAAEPLTINDLRGIYTGYPFELRSRFASGVPLHDKMIEVGWRTARLCAHETYMDCPYYEQLQYVGDTRIQGLVSIFNSGDGRLWRNAIEQIDSSRTAEGATLSRAPSVLQQYIPPFSLWWIGMVHDYWWYVDEPGFVKSMLPGAGAVIAFYERYLRADGLLGPMPWWNYVDWVPAWQNGRPPSESETMPCSIHLQFLLALRQAADLESALGDRLVAGRYRQLAGRLMETIRRHFHHAGPDLYTEDLAHREISQHANVLAVLAMDEPAAAVKARMQRVWQDKSMYPCSVYFRYYLDQAMRHCGLGDLYLQRLGTWEYMLQEGLTTFAEQDNPYSRSDCHAWSASPNIEFLRTVLGVDSAAPGFAKVSIRPHLGPLAKVSGAVPHARGMIEVTVEKKNGSLDVQSKLPPGVELVRR